MRFGEVDTQEAAGSVLVHSLRLPRGRLAKGRMLTTADIEALEAAGIDRVTVVQLDGDDMPEDDAAAAIAAALAHPNLRIAKAATGRANLYATSNGLFLAKRDVIDPLNRIDPAVTLATLADHASVRAGEMVATVKIIPLAVPASVVEKAVAVLAAEEAIAIQAYIPHNVVLIATQLPSLKNTVMDRTAAHLQRRLDPSGSRIVTELRVPHEEGQLAETLQQALTLVPVPDLIIVFGASAVSDPQDVIPAAIRAAGGEVERVGMPVDPGNLLVLGRVGAVPVVGAPGCARSPKGNGFDWVLNRILAGEPPTAHDITGMGVGGLLTEIVSRPQPRETARQDGELTVGALLLAAGQARRMGAGGPHKLLAEFGGVPLVRRSAQTLLASEARPVVAVTGHRRNDIELALDGLDLTTIFNAQFREGLSSSLVRGFSMPALVACDGVLVMLADMPGITREHVDRLVAAFVQGGGEAIVRASHQGKRGNPIILPRKTFDLVRKVEGDVGARAIVETSGLPIIDVDIGEAAHLDVDTPDAVTAAGGLLKS